MKTADRYGQIRIENACRRLLAFSSIPSLRNIVTILRNGQDKIPLNDARKPTPTPDTGGKCSKGITRGADAFRMGGDGK